MSFLQSSSNRRSVGILGSLFAASLVVAGCSSSSTTDTDEDAGKKTADTGTTSSGLPNCSSSGKNAYETYSKGFVAVNESIFTNVDTQLGTTAGKAGLGTAFTKIGTGDPESTSDNLATFKGKLAAFLVYAYGGPDSIKYTDGVTYSGKQSMETAHKGLNITSDQFTYFVNDVVVPALKTNGVTTDDVSSCFAPVILSKAFEASIVGQ